MKKLLLALLLLVLAAPAVAESDLVRDLLKLPPVPPSPGLPGEHLARDPKTGHVMFPAPSDDAPLEVLAAYWGEILQTGMFENQMSDSVRVTNTGATLALQSGRFGGKLSDHLRNRLLEASEADPLLLVKVIEYLPQTDETFERIKALYDTNQKRFGAAWKNKVGRFLMLHSKYFRDDLIEEAGHAHDGDLTSTAGFEELSALAVLDWERALPLLRRYEADTRNPFTAAFAQALICSHSVKTGNEQEAATYRSRLKRMAEDRKAEQHVRLIAIIELLGIEWNGRDEWYLSFFRDPTMTDLPETPLKVLPLENPDHWIPIISRLVESQDRVVHNVAADCLLDVAKETKRRDAWLPLLPWLGDEKWAAGDGQAAVRDAALDLNLPESVPYLVKMLRSENKYDAVVAAEALVKYHDPQAVPALRKAWQQTKSWGEDILILTPLLACHGITGSEAASAVELYADFTRTPEGEKQFDRYQDDKVVLPHAPELNLGSYLDTLGWPDESVTEQIRLRIAQLRSTKPRLADRLQSIIDLWPSRFTDQKFLRELQQGKAQADDVQSALKRRDDLRKNVSEELRATAAGKGAASGIAAVLLGSHDAETAILHSSDAESQRALLAASRLVHEPLRVDDVRPLLQSTDSRLTSAAEMWLQSDDSPLARELYLQRHRGELPVLGIRLPFYDDADYMQFVDEKRRLFNLEQLKQAALGGDEESETKKEKETWTTEIAQLDAQETAMRDAVRGPERYDEIFAFILSTKTGTERMVLRVRNSEADLIYGMNPARYYVRHLGHDELQQLKDFISKNRIDDLGPLGISDLTADGVSSAPVSHAPAEYLHVMPGVGRRVFIMDPGEGGSIGTIYDLLFKRFVRLANAAHMEVRYNIGSQLPGFEVMIADDRFDVDSVVRQGHDLRLRATFDSDLLMAETPRSNAGVLKLMIPDALQSEEKPQWVAVSNGLIIPASPPQNMPSDSLVPTDLAWTDGSTPGLWSFTSNNTAYREGTLKDQTGLWRFTKNEPPQLVLQGEISSPVVTPDGASALLILSGSGRNFHQGEDRNWAMIPLHQPSSAKRLMRVDLQSGQSHRVDLPGTVKPLIYVPEHHSVLVMLAKDGDQDAAHAKFWLVNPKTGHTQRVHGEFQPVRELKDRPLQSADASHYWAALYHKDRNATEIGHYDLANFAFTPLLTVPGLKFSSNQLWIDQTESKAYIAYDGQVLRIALAPALAKQRGKEH